MVKKWGKEDVADPRSRGRIGMNEKEVISMAEKVTEGLRFTS